MALRATVSKLQLEVSDIDRGHYASYALTVAKHPSETDERVLIRVVAFALNAHEHLTFAGDLSTAEEPALWRKDLTGAIEQWIEIGQPDARVLRKASSRSRMVTLYAYGRGADVWWSRTRGDLARFDSLSVFQLEPDQDLGVLIERNMALHALIQDGRVSLSSDRAHVDVTVVPLAL